MRWCTYPWSKKRDRVDRALTMAHSCKNSPSQKAGRVLLLWVWDEVSTSVFAKRGPLCPACTSEGYAKTTYPSQIILLLIPEPQQLVRRDASTSAMLNSSSSEIGRTRFGASIAPRCWRLMPRARPASPASGLRACGSMRCCSHAPTLSMLGECPDTHIACWYNNLVNGGVAAI